MPPRWIAGVLAPKSAMAPSADGSACPQPVIRRGRSTASLAPPPDEVESSKLLQTCTRCRRTNRHPNPVTRRNGSETLKFTTNSSAECLSCRNYFNSCCKGCNREELAKKLVESESHYQSYMTSLATFEQIFDDAGGKQLRRVTDKLKVPEFINVITEQSTEGRMNLGVFWPKDVYERIEKKDLLKDEEDVYTYKGKKMKGIIRDAKHGTPPRTISISTAQATTVQRTFEVDRGDQACRTGQMDETWDAVTKKMGVTSKQATAVEMGADDRFIIQANKKAKIDVGGANSDDSVDWADILNPMVSKAQDGATSESTSDSSASKAKGKKKRKKKKTSKHKLKVKRHVKKADPSARSAASASSVIPSSGNPVTPPSKKKVFPSVQMRSILNLEQLLNEAKSIFAAVASEEGFKALSDTKVTSFLNRIEAKIDTQEKVEGLTANNQSREGDTVIDLQQKGEAALREASSSKFKLSALYEAVVSFRSYNDSLEATSTYLTRTAVHTCMDSLGCQSYTYFIHT